METLTIRKEQPLEDLPWVVRGSTSGVWRCRSWAAAWDIAWGLPAGTTAAVLAEDYYREDVTTITAEKVTGEAIPVAEFDRWWRGGADFGGAL